MSNLNLNHLAICVKDMKKAYKFYNKVLGLPVVRITGTEENPQRVTLQGLELSIIRPESEDAGGFSHVGFEVSNIEKIYEALKEKGVVFDMPVRDIKMEAEGKAVKIVFFRDPDGNRIELVEWRDL